MGMRYTARLYKPAKKLNIEVAVLNAAARIGVYACQSKDREDTRLLRIGERGGIYTADFPYCDGDFFFFRQLAMELGGVWLEARIQEGSHWDYTLYYPGRPLDEFSTLPQYWDDDELLALSKQGRPELLAKAWNVPRDTIDRYIRQWGMRQIDEDTYETILKGKAYPTDRFEYGQYDQLFDFLEKLHYTTTMKWCFELRIPTRNFSPKREFIEDLSATKPV